MDQNKELNIKIKAVDVDKLLVALSKLPFEVVFELIPNIREQALAQLKVQS